MNRVSWAESVLRVGCLLTLAVASACGPQEAPTAGGKATVDPEAQKFLESFGKYVAGLQGFAVDVEIKLQVIQDGRDTAAEFNQKLRVERPNKLSFSLQSAGGSGQIVSNGEEVSTYLDSIEKYLVEKAPATLDAIFQNQLALSVISPGNATAMTLSLVSENPASGIISTAGKIKYGGLVTLDGVKCHLIEATGEQLDWKLWIDAGDKPLPRQFEPDLAKVIAQMVKNARANGPPPDIKVKNIVAYRNWQENPAVDAETFAFHAPEGVEKVTSVAELLGQRGEAEAPHPLLGKDAPPVELDLLDGGKLNLAQLKDKNVVILDFWATWCGPCQKAMPIIDKVAKSYQDKGVLLYAVDLEESADEVKKFVEERKLEVAIALDKDGAVGKAYGASAIPQTVIVGRDGTVQVVHVGLLPDLESQLRKELDALVAGKKLAEAPAAKQDAAAGEAATPAAPSEESGKAADKTNDAAPKADEAAQPSQPEASGDATKADVPAPQEAATPDAAPKADAPAAPPEPQE